LEKVKAKPKASTVKKTTPKEPEEKKPAVKKTETKAHQQMLQFAAEYTYDWNGKQAAIRAGYSERTAESQASRLLRNVKVIEEIERLCEPIEKKRKQRQQRVMQSLEEIAFDDTEVDETTDKEGNVVSVSRKDRLRALELVGKAAGLFKESEEAPVAAGFILMPVKMNPDEWAKLNSGEK